MAFHKALSRRIFLAESFFLPIDLRLQRENFRYVRYVDDIRIFCKSENEARKAIVLIEQECRHRGLIPQSAKIQVRELRTRRRRYWNST